MGERHEVMSVVKSTEQRNGKSRILIAEDEMIIATGIERILTGLGYDSAGIFTSGEQVLLGMNEAKPDLVLMAIRLQGDLDGIDTAGQICERYDIPIVYLTGYAEGTVLQDAKLTTPFGYVGKPVRARELRATIEMALYRHELERKLRESEERNHALLAALPDLMFIQSQDGTFVDGQVSSEENLYATLDEFLGKNIRDVLPSEVAEQDIEAIQQVLRTGETQNFEYALEVGGKLRYWESRLVPCGDEMVLSIVRDVSDRKQAEDRIRSSLAEKEVLLREIHHRVKNNLQVVSSLLTFQSDALENEEAAEAFRESQNRIQAMANVHEHLYRSDNLAQIDMANYIKELVSYLRQSYWAYGVVPKVEVADITLDVDTAIPCGLLINELVSNAIKHAFPSRREGESDTPRGEVHIALHPAGDGLELVVSDDGAGLPEDADLETAKSLGLRLVNLLTRQLQGELQVERGRESGTSFRITFPVQV